MSKIDGKDIWGTDGEIPKKAIKSLSISNNFLNIIIPPNAYKDLFEPNFSTAQVFIGSKNIIYIQMNNSDGAGGYSVIWIIKNNKYLKRYLDDINA